MKPGCFIKVLVVSTIIIAIILYFVTNNFEGTIKKPLQKYALSYAFDEVETKIDTTVTGEGLGELKGIFRDYKKELLNRNEIDLKELERVADTLGTILTDKIVTLKESQQLKEFINRLDYYEKHK